VGGGAAARAREVAVLIFDPQERFVKSAERNRAERHLPQRVIDLFERDVLLAEHVAHVHPVVVPADAAVAADASHLAVRRILERHEARRVRARRGRVAARGRRSGQRFKGPFLVELGAEGVEAPLLGAAVRLRRARGFGLERLVHALVPAVLLRVPGLDELGPDAESDPPHAQR
jgi:hypothetical protein